MTRHGTRHRFATAAGGLLAVVAAAGGLSGCMTSGPGSDLTVFGVFSDVNQLVDGAPVDMADISVGHVVAITLDGGKAKVQMAISRSARVPAGVTALLGQTSVLGNNFVQLQAPRSHTAERLLADGATIGHTGVQPEVEQLVGAGSQVFGSISSTDLAAIVQAGGEGFGGQSSNIRQLLNDLSAVTAGYASRTGDIQSLIVNLDQLGSGLAPSASQDAQALSNLSQTVAVLSQQSSQFIDLLQSLDDLAVQGHGLLGLYLPQLDDELTSLAATASELARHQQDLAGLVQNLPGYNVAAKGATVKDFLQVFEDIIVCGIPGGGENRRDPAATCAPSSGG